MRGGSFRAPEVLFAGGLALCTVAVRLLMAHPLHFCGTPDACYYLGMAQNLAAGQGFHARFLFDFQQAQPTLPNTGIEYWRPGISLLLSLLKPFGGVTLHSSIALTTLVGVLYAAAAWHIAKQTYNHRSLALGAFALCLLSSSAWTGSISPDSGLYYGAAVAWFLALFTVRRQGLIQDIVALVCVSLAYLVRNDAALLLLPVLAVLWGRRRVALASPEPAAGASLPYALAMLAGFAIALLPMHLLYKAVLGTAFPAGTTGALYLNDLADFVRYGAPVSARTLLSYGWKHLVLYRLSTFATVVYRIAVLMIGYPALVFLPGLLMREGRTTASEGTSSEFRRLPELTGSLVFFLFGLFAYTAVLPAVGQFSALRTAVGVMPLASVLVMVAIVRVARTPRLAAVLATGVIAATALGGLMDDRRLVVSMNGTGDDDRAEAKALAQLGARPQTAIVLTGDPVQFSVTTGYATIALPINGLDAITAAAHRFRATHVMLNSEDLPASMEDLNRQLQPVRSIVLPAEHTLILALPRVSGDD